MTTIRYFNPFGTPNTPSNFNSVMQFANSPAGQLALNATIAAGRRVANMFRSRGEGRRSLGWVTSQHDVRTQYSKKRSFKKRRVSKKGRVYKNIKRWVKKRQFSTIGTKIVVRNGQVGSATDVSNQTVPSRIYQNYMVGTLYGNKGTDYSWEQGNADCASIVANEADINNAGKFYFTSARLDATIKNGEVAAEVDVYDIVYKGQVSTVSFETLKANSESQTDKINTNIDKVTLQQTRGSTLFDFPMLLKYGRIKILKKTKLFLPAGGTALYSFGDKRIRCYDQDRQNDMTGYVIPGWTRSMVVVHKAVDPTLNSTVNLGMTRSYKYKIIEQNKIESNKV